MIADLRHGLLELLDSKKSGRSTLVNRALPLRVWLLLLSLVAMLPVMLFAGYTIFELQSNGREELLARLQSRTNDAARTIDQAIRKHIAILNTLTDNPSFEAGDFEKVYEQARRAVQSQPSIRAITLVNTTDRIMWATAVPYGSPPMQTYDLPSLHKAFKTGSPTLSRAFFGPFNGIPVFLVSVPVTKNGSVQYVIRAAVRIDSLENHLADLHLPEGWVAGIAEEGGRLIARSRLSQQFMDKPASPEFIAAIHRHDVAPFKSTTVDGVIGRSVIAPVLDGNWYLGIGVSDQLLLAPLRAVMTELVVLGVVWLILGLALARWLSIHLSNQAKKLVDAIYLPTISVNPPTLSVTEFNLLLSESLATRKAMLDIQTELESARSERDETFLMYEQAPCGYHSLDASGRVVRMNQTELTWLGYGLEDVVGRHITDFMTATGKARFEANFPKFLADGELSNLPLEFVKKDGATLSVLVNAISVRDDAGNYVMSRSTLVPFFNSARESSVR